VLAARGAERRVVEVHQIERLLHIVFKFVKGLELVRGRREAFAGRRFEKHLIAAIQQNADFRAD